MGTECGSAWIHVRYYKLLDRLKCYMFNSNWVRVPYKHYIVAFGMVFIIVKKLSRSLATSSCNNTDDVHNIIIMKYSWSCVHRIINNNLNEKYYILTHACFERSHFLPSTLDLVFQWVRHLTDIMHVFSHHRHSRNLLQRCQVVTIVSWCSINIKVLCF